MKDNEIIKALECCKDNDCDNCPFEEQCRRNGSLADIALDLINRQKAEIVKLEKVEKYADKTIKAQAAEIERLQAENKKQKAILEEINDEINPLPFETDFDIAMKKAKYEAIKEFAERLKIEAFECDVSFGYGKECYQQAVAVIEIDNLVKEMTEDENENH